MLRESDEKLAFYNSDKYKKIEDEEMKKAEDSKAKMEKLYKKWKRVVKDGLN